MKYHIIRINQYTNIFWYIKVINYSLRPTKDVTLVGRHRILGGFVCVLNGERKYNFYIHVIVNFF